MGSRLLAASAFLLGIVAIGGLGCGLDEQGICGAACLDVGNVPDATVDVTVDGTVEAAADATADAPRDLSQEPVHDARRDTAAEAARDVAPRDGKAQDAPTDTHPGCKVPTDCPKDEACDTATGKCGTWCSGSGQCNGGCCDGLICQPGNTSSLCGVGGATCSVCGGSAGSKCLPSGACGCMTQTDCPTDQACKACACGTFCGMGATPCNGGCCDGTNCQPGTAPTACAAGGPKCMPCANPTPTCSGAACRGCTGPTDCPVGMACDTSTGSCSTRCLVGYYTLLQCNGGCCDAANNCVPGDSATGCGNDGNVCQFCNCGAPACIGGQCGCNSDSQCSPGGYYCSVSVCDLEAGTAGLCF